MLFRSVGIWFIAKDLIVIFFGEEYAPSVLALQILIGFLPFSFINSITQYILIAVNRQRFLTLAFVIGAAFNLAANLVAIPLFSFYGAAAITILSELILLVPFYYAVRQELGPVPWLDLIWKPAAAASIMALALWPLRQGNLVVVLGAGAAVYLAALFLLRTFDEEDRALLAALRRR